MICVLKSPLGGFDTCARSVLYVPTQNHILRFGEIPTFLPSSPPPQMPDCFSELLSYLSTTCSPAINSPPCSQCDPLGAHVCWCHFVS